MSKHTPGPWEVRTLDMALGSIDAADGNQVAQAQEVSASDRNSGHKTRIANAHLIAAAPDLLEALRGCLQKGSRWHTCDPVVMKAREAIAKATGAA